MQCCCNHQRRGQRLILGLFWWDPTPIPGNSNQNVNLKPPYCQSNCLPIKLSGISTFDGFDGSKFDICRKPSKVLNTIFFYCFHLASYLLKEKGPCLNEWPSHIHIKLQNWRRKLKFMKLPDIFFLYKLIHLYIEWELLQFHPLSEVSFHTSFLKGERLSTCVELNIPPDLLLRFA